MFICLQVWPFIHTIVSCASSGINATAAYTAVAVVAAEICMSATRGRRGGGTGFCFQSAVQHHSTTNCDNFIFQR